MLEERVKDLPVVVQQMSTDNLGARVGERRKQIRPRAERMKREDKLSADVTILEAASTASTSSSAPDFVLRAAETQRCNRVRS